MRDAIILLSRALMIALAFAVLGIAANLASHDPVSLVYAPPRETVISNVKLILIDEKEAVQYLKDPGAVFVDCREFEDYQKSHIQKALCLPPDDFENRFPAMETLLPLESKIILYCYGPTCDMAEKVGVSLGQMGYMNLMIMSSGFPAWEQAKYPVESSAKKEAAHEDILDQFMEGSTSHFRLDSLNLNAQLRL